MNNDRAEGSLENRKPALPSAGFFLGRECDCTDGIVFTCAYSVLNKDIAISNREKSKAAAYLIVAALLCCAQSRAKRG